jgi:hypothetical protein
MVRLNVGVTKNSLRPVPPPTLHITLCGTKCGDARRAGSRIGIKLGSELTRRECKWLAEMTSKQLTHYPRTPILSLFIHPTLKQPLTCLPQKSLSKFLPFHWPSRRFLLTAQPIIPQTKLQGNPPAFTSPLAPQLDKKFHLQNQSLAYEPA